MTIEPSKSVKSRR